MILEIVNDDFRKENIDIKNSTECPFTVYLDDSTIGAKICGHTILYLGGNDISKIKICGESSREPLLTIYFGKDEIIIRKSYKDLIRKIVR